MNLEDEHRVWVQQVEKLISSKRQLQQTGASNMLFHFFSQVIERDFKHELEPTRRRLKRLTQTAVELAPTLSGSTRDRAAAVLGKVLPLDESVIDSIRLNDLRNVVVFEMFKRCGVTTDTYLERYSSPPGTEEQSRAYLRIAHGKAVCTAVWVEKLTFLLNSMHLLKTVFLVYDLYANNAPGTVDASTLNWHGEKWAVHVANKGLADLVWNLFLDVWEYEHSVFK